MFQKILHFVRVLYSISFNLGIILIVIIIGLEIFVGINIFFKTIQNEVPYYGFHIALIISFGASIFLGMTGRYLRYLYDKFPILAPIVTIIYVTFFGVELALKILNLWAQYAILGKSFAILLAVLAFCLVRLALSIWYKFFPIES
ncbi:hypothetical protein [Leptospira sarikeiensis]|uniref:Uncharacterized protein n=1 Tax=Leptospira sarikeiensis TaxID=2484943 RepID=A0A4R9K8H9_9LEPT|nr:hypothetical protein [Leptospira sarikeiensis]TGL61700.1 hypothetical protein EHQ64_10060 [Leptospira sarikeiensis]